MAYKTGFDKKKLCLATTVELSNGLTGKRTIALCAAVISNHAQTSATLFIDVSLGHRCSMIF
jgi:hypothetical protein